VSGDDHLYRGAAAALLGLAYWTSGDLEPAYRSYAEGMESLRLAGNVIDTIGGSIALADIRIAQGRLRDAMTTYQQAMQVANDQDGPAPRGTADLFVGMSELHYEWGDLESAAGALAQGAELGDAAGFPQNPYRRRVALARLRTAQGDLDGAIELLDEAERRYVSDMYPNVRPVAALRARVWIAQGRIDDALSWARARGLSIDNEPSYLRAFEHVTLARALLAQASGDRSGRSLRQAMDLLSRLLADAEAGGRMGGVIEILALQARAYQLRGDIPAALERLERALALAEPEGYVRTFLDEGEPMRRLLREAAGGERGSYARRLTRLWETAGLPSSAHAPAAAATLPEPLTPREVEILRLIAAGLRNQEIADQLFISLPTVKRHVANAYGKLEAAHRTEAIAKANALNLL
jgi:LuxR family maltose regulon positive regulatory protein